MRLWELEGGDGGEVGHGFGGGVNGLPWDLDDDDDDDDLALVPVVAPLVQPAPHGHFAPPGVLAPVGPLVPFGPPRPPPAPANRPVRERDPGLQRFLRMAHDDEEDE